MLARLQQRLDLADAVLQEISAPGFALLDDVEGVGELEVLRQDQDADLGILAGDLLGGLEPLGRAGRRHADVHERDVGTMSLDLAIQRLAVGHAGDDVHAALAQHGGDAIAHQRRVVGDHHAYRGAAVAIPLGLEHQVPAA